MSIAKTIHSQIVATAGTIVMWSWGASAWTALGESADKTRSVQGIGEDYSGALMFYVRGALHKGHVIVSLNYMDEYTVSIGHVRKGKIVPKKQVKGIHFDMLGTVIDGLIETPKAA